MFAKCQAIILIIDFDAPFRGRVVVIQSLRIYDA